jgi:hypothetical protein
MVDEQLRPATSMTCACWTRCSMWRATCSFRNPRVALALQRFRPAHRIRPDHFPALYRGLHDTGLEVEPVHRVLEIGTGSGYQAAVLGRLVKTVYTIEIIAPLAERARATLLQLGYRNVEVRTGNGYHGMARARPLRPHHGDGGADGGAPALVQQLKLGGLMAIPWARTSRNCAFSVVCRKGWRRSARSR